MSHIAIAIPGLDRIAGAERQAMLLAEGLRRRGWRVTMVALSGEGSAAAGELAQEGVAFLSLGMRKGIADPRGWMRFQRWLRRERPDVLHAHLPHAAWFVRWSGLAAQASLVPVPLIVDTLHSTATGKPCRRFGYVTSRWLTDHVTAVSEAAAEAHLAAGMVSPERLAVVPNGIDVDRWRPDAESRAETRKELGCGDEFVWLAVGRLEPVKDYPALLSAFARLPEAARLLILGAGALDAELQQRTRALGLATRVRFAGFCSNPRRFMQAADGFVLASRIEGLPMVLLEAGACGLPAVATDVAGTREAIVHGETGWLAPAADPDGLAATMLRLMKTPAGDRRALGENARQFVANRFGLAAVLDRWEQLYTELLEQRRSRRRTGRSAWASLSRRSAPSA